jgi:serine protease Do
VKQTGNTVYVLTNNHVAGNASTISVKLSDGRHFKATLVGKDPNRDLAVIKFQTNQKVPVATLGNSTDIAPGDWVLAIGNPLGYQSTVTAGIVSALDRQAAPNSGLGVYTDYIQTDAAINPGNSGGALVNMQGQVVGINTWIASKSGGSIGIGFAIPINIAHKVMNDLINTGHVAYGWTGVNVGDPPQAVTDSMGLSSTPGAFVYDVYKNSPAYRAGLLPGDYVTKVNGSKVTDTSELLYTIANLNPGATVDFTLIRQGRMMNVNVTIGKRAEGQNMANEVSLMWPGLAVLPLTPDIQNQVGLPSGVGKVIISSVENGSRSAHAGFQPGDVIQAINGRTINNLKDFYAAIDSSNTSHFEFKIFRQGAQLLVGLNKA